MYPLFEKIISQNGLTNITYVEPFAGGAGVGLALLLLNKVKHIVINDLDKAIYSFWKSAINKPEEFIDMIYSTPVTVDEWYNQKSIYENRKSGQLQLGFATFFLNRTNVSGIIGARPIGGLGQKGIWKIDARFGKARLVDMIIELSLYKNQITISNEHGLKLIQKHLKKKRSLIYLDPPYYEKGASLYLNHYLHSDHLNLSRKLNKNPNSNWVLTYDNHRVIRSMYEDRFIQKFSLFHNAYKVQKGHEFLILSDRLAS